MARSIVVNWGGEVSEFGLERVSRDKLYGRKIKVVVDEDGNATETAYLTRDGSALLLKGAMAMIYVNDEFEVAERSDLLAVDHEGKLRDRVESTLGVEQELRGPIDPSRVLDHIAKAIYLLDPEMLGDKLKAALEDGQIFETVFAYRSGFDSSPAFLLKNDDAFFAIVGDEVPFDLLYKEQAAVVDDDDDDEDPFSDDDLDFGMF